MEVNEPSTKYLVQAGYKQTEIGWIPSDWALKSVGDIASVSAGGTPSRKLPEYWNGDIPWVTTTELNKEKVTETEQHISRSGLENSSAKMVAAGSVLIALYGQGRTRGKVSMLEISAATNQACAAISVSTTASNRFVFHSLHSQYRVIRALSNSGSQDNLSSGIVKGIPLPLPPTLAEQDAIATALSDADALIESLEQLLAKKRQIKQGAMQELLTGQRRLPGFSGEWTSSTLSQLANIQRGASPRPIDDPIWFDEESSVGWVRIADVTQTGIYLENTTQRLSALGVQHSRPVPKGSLIMSICATVGRPVITKIDTCIHDGFVVFDRLQGDQAFVYYVLRSIEDNWSRQGQTGSQMNLNTGLINSTVVAMPPTTEEQTAIATILSDMDAELTALEARLKKARDLKQGMAQALLTGRIRLVPGCETADTP